MFSYLYIKFNQDKLDPVKVEKCKPCALPYSVGWGFYKNYRFFHLYENGKLEMIKPLPSRGNEHVD
jgi:hypothetical protein